LHSSISLRFPVFALLLFCLAFWLKWKSNHGNKAEILGEERRNESESEAKLKFMTLNIRII